MPVFKDEERGTYYVKCYYTDYTGAKKQKKKRGFKLQREAKEWERKFLETQQNDLTMNFESFTEIYLEDMSHRVKEHTLYQKRFFIKSKLIPYFGKLPLSDITPAVIRKWQNELIAYRDPDGEPYKPTYLKAVNVQLSSIFNYAVQYYNLPVNPCRKAGSIGTNKAEEMQFWTLDEFKQFLENISDKPRSRAAFLILYYTGMRIGELLALECQDIDLINCKINITKSYQRIEGRDLITTPKTPKSIRTVTIPEFLRDEIKTYLSMLYELQPTDRIFGSCTKQHFETEMKRGTKSGTPKKIRIHDIRHSHASLLIELGFSPLVIADRLGHEKVETTLNTYSHLFPHKRDEVADRLQSLF